MMNENVYLEILKSDDGPGRLFLIRERYNRVVVIAIQGIFQELLSF